MAAMNPNPSRITGAIWDLWLWFDQLEPTVSLGGVFAPKGGYHDIRNGHGGDYSVFEVSTDREGPGDKASAIDLTMSAAAMRKYTSRLDAAAKARDPRLYIGGQAIIREFIGTKDSSRVYCYVLVGGRARGLGADASEDWGRDSTHLWHIHISIIRKFCASADAMDRLFSVLNGESLSAWKARRGPASQPAEDLTEEDENVSQQIIPLPRGFAYDEEQNEIGKEFAVSVPVEPAGLAANAVFGKKRLYLSLAGDHTENGPVKVRVAIHNGEGWKVELMTVPSGGRVSVPVPAPKNGAAYNVTAGRMMSGEEAGQEEANRPCSLLVTVA